MLEYSDGWIFVGLDGKLYKVEFDLEGYWNESSPDMYVVTNGWRVTQVRAETWGVEFPVWRP